MYIQNESGPGYWVDIGDGPEPSTAQAGIPQSNDGYAVRGNYRIPVAEFGGRGGGPLEVKNANGLWEVVTQATAPSGYDARQDSNAQGSNERLRFNEAFRSAPASVPITGLQQYAMSNGWQEPDRSSGGLTLGGMLSDMAPYVGMFAGGVGALNGLAGLGAMGAGGTGAAATSGMDMLYGGMPELGAGATGAASAAGSMAPAGWTQSAWDGLNGLQYGNGGDAMDFTDFWDYGSGAGDVAGQLAPYGQSMATAEELAQMQAQYPDWLNKLTGVTETGLPSMSNASSWIKSLMSGAGGGTDWMKTLGSLGAAGLGAYAANKQTNALQDQANRYEGYGAPYRQKLSDLYADPSSFLKSPGVTNSVDQGTSALMRSLSTQGNPFGSGNALQQGQSYATNSLYDKLNQEKQTLGSLGGMASFNNAAPQAATGAIQSGSGPYVAAAKAMGDIFNPPQTQAQSMADFYKAMGKV